MPVVGPGLSGAPGLPTQGALGVTNVAGQTNCDVGIASPPTLPIGGTNVTIVAWIYPTTSETGATAIVMQRGSTANGLAYYGSTAQNLGFVWDNNSPSTYYAVSSLVIPTNEWSMVAMAISPGKSTLYLGNTNQGVASWTTNMVNSYVAWGNVFTMIGEDGGTVPGRNFAGYISSVAIFSNTLSPAQIGTLYAAGASNGVSGSVQAPIIITDIPVWAKTTFLVAGGTSSSITATAFCGGNGNGYWQVNYGLGGGWVPLNSPDFASSVTNTVTVGAFNQTGTLTVANFQAADAGSYQLIFTNAGGAATSSVVTLNLAASPPAGSFAAQVLNPANGFGIMSLWPLNETNDPSGALANNPAVAFDIAGGFNGIYGVNARDGGTNSAYGFAPVAGPGSGGAIGLPVEGALGVTNAVAYETSYVTVPVPPTLPSNAVPGVTGYGTNATIVAWIYPTAAEAGATAIVMQRGSTANGLAYYGSTAQDLGFVWDNNAASTYIALSSLPIPTNERCMLATPTGAWLHGRQTW
jgi:hypothetical protein